MSRKKVALVGHCGPDSSFLRMAVSSADRSVEVVSADSSEELKQVLDAGVDLLLLNREMPYGFDDNLGVEVIRRIRAHYPHVRMMLISNYPEAQSAAIAEGAAPGFGKREIGSPKVAQALRHALGDD